MQRTLVRHVLPRRSVAAPRPTVAARFAGTGGPGGAGRRNRTRIVSSIIPSLHDTVFEAAPGEKGAPKAYDFDISVPEVRLVEEEQSTVMKTTDALHGAITQGLHLVVVSHKAKPPVVKMMTALDYIAILREENLSAAATVTAAIAGHKQMKLRSLIEQHDFDVKLKKTRKLVEKAYVVKLIISPAKPHYPNEGAVSDGFKHASKDIYEKFFDSMRDIATSSNFSIKSPMSATVAFTPTPAVLAAKAKVGDDTDTWRKQLATAYKKQRAMGDTAEFQDSIRRKPRVSVDENTALSEPEQARVDCRLKLLGMRKNGARVTNSDLPLLLDPVREMVALTLGVDSRSFRIMIRGADDYLVEPRSRK